MICESNADVKAFLTLIFAYHSFDIALRAMDAVGDDISASAINKIRSEWDDSGNIPDLSHETRVGPVRMCPTQEEIIRVCTSLIDAYDTARESGEWKQLNLRKSVEALFELRAFARLACSDSDANKLSKGKKWLKSSLSELPIPVATSKKLVRAGYSTLESLMKVNDESISALTGLSHNQISKCHEVIFNYLEHHCAPQCDYVAASVSHRLSKALRRTVVVCRTNWYTWLRIAHRPEIRWHQLLIAIENIEEFTNSFDEIIAVLEKLNTVAIDWSHYPFNSDELDATERLSHLRYTALKSVPRRHRPMVEEKLRAYFMTQGIYSLFDVVSHPYEKFLNLGKFIDEEFNLGNHFQLGLVALQPNILRKFTDDNLLDEKYFALKPDWLYYSKKQLVPRTKLLLNLIENVTN